MPRVVEKLSRSQALVLLRYTLIIAMAYLVLVEHEFSSTPGALILLIVAALASNVLVAQLPARITESTAFYTAVILGDTLWITAALVYSGMFGADFFYLYFFVLLLAGIGENMGLIAVGATVVCLAYVFVVSASGGTASLWSSRLLIRIPFLLTAAAFYGYIVDRVRRERQRAREEAETVAHLEEIQLELSQYALRLERANEDLGREIAQRERAEQDLKEAKDYAENLIDSSLDMIVSTDINRNVVEFNQAAEDAFGYSKAEVVGKPIDMLYGDPSESLRVQTMLQNDGRFAGEIRNKRKNGESFYSYVSASVIRDLNGRIVGGVGVSRDITERKRAEEALRESEVRFRTLCSHAPVGIFLTDSEGEALFVNDRVCEMAEMTPEQLRGEGWSRALHPEDRERIVQGWSNVVKGGGEFDHLFRFRTPQGKVTWLQSSAVTLRNDAEEITGYLGTLTDITERKGAEEALQAQASELATQTDRLEALATLSRTVSATLDPPHLVDFVVGATVPLLGANVARFWLWDEAAHVLRLAAKAGDPDLTPYPVQVLHRGESFAGQAFEHGEVLVTDSPSTDSRYGGRDWARENRIQAVAAVPLLVGERAIGVLTAARRAGGSFQVEELTILRSFASQTAIALENARLYSEALEKTDRLEGLIRTSAKVTGTLEAEEVLGGIAEEAAKLLRVEGAGFRLFEGDRLVVRGKYGLADSIMLDPSVRVGESLSGLVAQEGRPISVSDLREDQRFLPEHTERAVANGVVAYLGVPLRYRHRIIGALNVYGKEPRSFQEREVDLLQAFGDQAAIAIENARLFEDIAKGKREWESTFNAIADGIALLDQEGTVIRANRAFGFWWQPPTDVLIGASWHDLWDRLGVSSPCPHCEAWSVKGTTSAEVHVPAVNRGLALAAFPLEPRDPGPTESFIGTILVIRDVTERKQAEEELRESEERYRTLFQNAPIGFGVADADGTLLAFNNAMLAPGGYTRDDIARIGNVEHLYDDPDQRAIVLATANKQGFLRQHEVRFRRKDGSCYNALLSLTPITIGGRLGWQAMVEDITERKRAAEELKATQLQLMQSERLESVGRLAAGVAHEVKNPLAIILQGLAYFSQTPLTANDDNVGMVLEKMDNAVRRADRVIRGLLDFSAESAGDVRPVELNGVLEQSLLLVHHEFVKARVTVVKALGENLPRLKLDRQKIEQVFVNLFLNAIQAMPEGGTLTVKTHATQLTELGPDSGHRRGDQFRVGETLIVVEVEDTGTGIPEDKLGRIFDPFFTTKPTGQGTGLGLTVTRKIIELHRGTIEVRNRQEGGIQVILTFQTDEDLRDAEEGVSAKMTGGAQNA